MIGWETEAKKIQVSNQSAALKQNRIPAGGDYPCYRRTPSDSSSITMSERPESFSAKIAYGMVGNRACSDSGRYTKKRGSITQEQELAWYNSELLTRPQNRGTLTGRRSHAVDFLGDRSRPVVIRRTGSCPITIQMSRSRDKPWYYCTRHDCST